MSLLDTKTGYTTPWHCSVALMADGEWISAAMVDFKEDPIFEIVCENGRPSYFQEKTCESHKPSDDEKSASKQQTSKRLNGHSASLVSDTNVDAEESMGMANEKRQNHLSMPAGSRSDESEEKNITELTRTPSSHGVKNEKGEIINPFFGAEHPLLDPKSGKFSLKAWLETLVNITSRDPQRYPKMVTGVAYKNLSAHGFGEPTDYQKTFGNYPFKLLSLAKRLVGKGKKTRIQILKDFDGLVKGGEMLVVLGRPGR